MDVRRATAYAVGIYNFQIRIRLNESAHNLRQDISFRRRFRCDVNGIAFTILLHPHSTKDKNQQCTHYIGYFAIHYPMYLVFFH